MVIDLEAIKNEETLSLLHKPIVDPLSLADLLRSILKSEQYIDQGKEHFWAIGLDTHNVVKYIDLIALGTLSAALVHPRETFRLAVLSGVSSLIVAHNHPSGNTAPSDEDIRITNRLINAGSILGIDLLDSVIVSETNCTSVKETGNLPFNWSVKKQNNRHHALHGSIVGEESKINGPFKNVLEVERYLAVQGWKIKKSSVYAHVKDRKLIPDAQGQFSREEIDRYALMNLKTKDSPMLPAKSGANANYRTEILDYMMTFEGLKRSEQYKYTNETSHIFAFLRRAITNLCSTHDELKPNDDEMFGMQLIFDEVDKRMRVSQAAFSGWKSERREDDEKARHR